MISVFVINLDRSEERLAEMRETFSAAGLDFERFPAVEGRTLGAERLSKESSKAEVYASFRKGLPMTAGEIGCALSHLGVYRKMVDEGIEEALVCEDDIIVADRTGMKELLISVLLGRSDAPRLVLLEYLQNFEKPERLYARMMGRRYGRYRLVRPYYFPTKAGCYLINLSAARLLLRYAENHLLPADLLTGNADRLGVELYLLCPRVVISNPKYFQNEKSTILERQQIMAHDSRGEGEVVRSVFYGLIRGLYWFACSIGLWEHSSRAKMRILFEK